MTDETDAGRAIAAQDASEAACRLAPAVVQALRGQRLFVTGGTGFVGKWLLMVLLAAHAQHGLALSVTVLTRHPRAFAASQPDLAGHPVVTLHEGDVRDFTFPLGRFGLVVHAALPVANLAAEAGTLERTATAGLQRVLDFAVQAGATRFLHVSSGAVYGAQPAPGPIEEAALWSEPPANDYTRAKRAAEHLCGAQWPFDIVIARCFAFVGPYLDPASGSAAAQFIEAAARGDDIVVQGDGRPQRSYQYAADMAVWLTTLAAVAPAGLVCNVGSAQPVSIGELAQRVAAAAGATRAPQVRGTERTGLAGNAYVPDVARARNVLGLVNHVELDSAIARTLAWRRALTTSKEATV